MSLISKVFRPAAAAVGRTACLTIISATGFAAEKVRVALGDVVSVETLAFILALERAKDRGVDYELTSFAKEELSIQAIVNEQADLGVAGRTRKCPSRSSRA